MSGNVALVAGASGHVGSQLIDELKRSGGWTIVALARRSNLACGVVSLNADLLAGDIAAALARAPHPTHIFYCVRAPHSESGKEDVEANLTMLRELIEAAEVVSPHLAHVHIVEGGKWYGAHLGPYRTPACEDDPRHVGPNFYHAQEDWLRLRQRGKAWTWSASRPSYVCAVTPGRSRNLVSLLGAYAALCRAEGLPLDYPGSAESFQSLTEITEAGLLARAMIFLATDVGAANQSFNVTNGDALRWSNFWPQLAAYFGMPAGEPRPLRLSDWGHGKESLWQKIVRNHGLQNLRLDEVANWPFGDFVFGQEHDVLSSTVKIHQSGFHETVNSADMLLQMMDRYRALKIIP